MRIRPTPEQFQASLEAEAASKRYEQELRSTEIGRRSDALREQAAALVHQGRVEEAYQKAAEAARMFADDDPSAAAVSARHDLADFILSRVSPTVEQLLLAERCARSAVDSDVRKRDPLRHCRSMGLLARCLRALDACARDTWHETWLHEAEQLARQAAEREFALGPFAWHDAFGSYVNLGNLYREQGRIREALTAYDRAVALDDWCVSTLPEHRGSEEYTLLRLNVASCLFERREPGDLDRAETLLSEIARVAPTPFRSQVTLLRVEVLLARGQITRARRELDGMDAGQLVLDDRLHLADVLRRAGRAEEGLAILRDVVRLAHRNRSRTVTDSDSDEATSTAEEAAAQIARIEVERGRYAEAFLALEDTVSLRFIEATEMYCFSPDDGISRALHERYVLLMNAAYLLHLQAQNFEPSPRETQRQHLQEFLDALRLQPDGTYRTPRGIVTAEVVDPMRGALAAEHPTDHLRDAAAGIEREINRIHLALREREPLFAYVEHEKEATLTTVELAKLAEVYQEMVLLHLAVHHDSLVAIAAWWDGGALVTLGHHASVSLDLQYLLSSGAQKGETPAALARQFERIDLRALWDGAPQRRLAVIPSGLATRLPIAALGSQGHRPIDRFDAIVWLPNTFPLRTRQDSQRARQGVVAVAPGDTNFHDLALRSLTGADRLEGDQATVDSFASKGHDADVVVYFGHAEHEPFVGPELMLHGHRERWPRTVNRFVEHWAGMERIELWACESGFSANPDLLASPVTDAFGLDYDFVRKGVRTAIGTLHPVLDFVTACIANRHWRNVLAGIDAPRSLADAQRWWLQEGLPELLSLLAKGAPHEAIKTFSERLGAPASTEQVDAILSRLGPAPDPASPLPQSEIAALRERWSAPAAWAAYRFIGLPERRPREPRNADHERALTEEERAHARELAMGGHVARIEDADESLDRIESQQGDEPATPERALLFARLYRNRVTSSYRHNLLVALAWLHEALAGAPSDRERNLLTTEAAHLWLDVAVGEVHVVPALMLCPPDAAPLARARALCGSLDASPDARAAQARLRLYEARWDQGNTESFRRYAAEAWRWIEPVAFADAGSGWQTLRVLCAACEILSIAPEIAPGAAARLISRLEDALVHLHDEHHADPIAPAAMRAQIWGRYLARRAGLPWHPTALAPQMFTPRETLLFLVDEHVAPGSWNNEERSRFVLSDALGQLESAIWGFPSDDRTPFVASSGTTGRGQRALTGDFLRGATSQEHHASHLLASLQLSADLRPGLWRNMARILGHGNAPPQLLEHVWAPMRLRAALMDALSDVVATESTETGSPDPFTHSPEHVQAHRETPASWILAELLDVVRALAPSARTAAFRLVRANRHLAVENLKKWRSLLEAEKEAKKTGPAQAPHRSIARELAPENTIQKLEDELDRLAPGDAVMGVHLEPMGGMVLSAVWRGHERTGGHVVHVPLPSGHALKSILALLIGPDEDDWGPQRGRSRRRAAAWAEVAAPIADGLRELFAELPDGEMFHLQVFATGALRPLPWLGLLCGSPDLGPRIASVRHIPHLGFKSWSDNSLDDKVGDGCYADTERRYGDTSFGEAAISTLRALFRPRHVLDEVMGRSGELATLEALAPRLRSLRLYGQGEFAMGCASAAVLRLGDHGTFGLPQTFGLHLTRCDAVELWACTADGDIGRILRDDGDRIPPLASHFLACGANGVLDLAWPVPDLVQAMVCETHGVLRRTQAMDGPFALRVALTIVSEWIAAALAARGAMSSVRDLLGFLDDARRRLLVEQELDATRLVPFAGREDAPSLAGQSLDEVFETMLQGCNLGAFRYWGG